MIQIEITSTLPQRHFGRVVYELRVTHEGAPIPSRQLIFETFVGAYPQHVESSCGAVMQSFRTRYGSNHFRTTLLVYSNPVLFTSLTQVKRHIVQNSTEN